MYKKNFYGGNAEKISSFSGKSPLYERLTRCADLSLIGLTTVQFQLLCLLMIPEDKAKTIFGTLVDLPMKIKPELWNYPWYQGVHNAMWDKPLEHIALLIAGEAAALFTIAVALYASSKIAEKREKL
ncbi:MAG: hypothetical protein ACPL06_04520 [Candidatus Anstonellales archaeon]